MLRCRSSSLQNVECQMGNWWYSWVRAAYIYMCACSTPGLGSIELPDYMSRLTSLRRLILSGWCYSSLPAVVGRLSQIQELDFR